MERKFVFLNRRYSSMEVLVAAICVLPALTLAAIFIIVPVVQVFYLSLTNWSLIKDTSDFIGFGNYSYLFEDTKFWKAIANTLYFTGLKIPLDLVLALGCAVLLDQKVLFRRFFRAAYFAPVVVPIVASGLIWIWFYDPGIGPFNQVLQWLGLPALAWLHDEKTSMISIIIFSTWKALGYNMVIFLAGLQSISSTYVEAAKLDGASAWRIFSKIKLPLLSPVLYFVILIGIINSFKVFTEVSIMTPNGGPGYSTAVMVYYIYEQAFNRFMMGRAAAASVVLFAIMLVITLIQKRAGSKKVFYE